MMKSGWGRGSGVGLLLLGLVLALGRVGGVAAADGDLDPTFGTGGVATTLFSRPAGAGGGALVRQADGKMVLAGYVGTTPGSLALVRLNADGSRDTTFGTNGQVTTLVPLANGGFASSPEFAGLVLQPDGRILLGGSAEQATQGRDWVLLRYDINGSPDLTFGSGGLVRIAFGQYNDDLLGGLAVQPDGKIVLGGWSRGATGPVQLALARLAADGTLDPTFDGDGLLLGASGFANTVLLQPDGKIVLAGGTAAQGAIDFLLARYNPDGSPDLTWDGDGLVTTDFGTPTDQAISLVLGVDGSLTTLGEARTGTYASDFALARYTATGSLDLTFGSGGKVTTDFGAGDTGNSLALQPNGKLVAAGTRLTNTRTGDLALARYNTDGTLDPTFSGDGQVTYDLGEDDAARSVLVASDGTLLVGGRGANIMYYPSLLALRLLPDGSLDGGFATGGVSQQPVYWSNATAGALAVQPDGAVLLGGTTNSVPYLIRYTPSGQLDPAFGASGVVTPTRGTNQIEVHSLAVQADGRIIVAGSLYDFVDHYTLLIRYLADGSVDPSFGVGGFVLDNIGMNGRSYANAVLIQPDGAIVIAGGESAIGYLVARYLPSGTRDRSFNTYGWSGFGSPTDFAIDVALQPNGKLVVTGWLRSSSGNPARYGVGRLNADGTPDAGFGTNGLVIVPFPAQYTIGDSYYVAVQPDGKLVVVGDLHSNPGLGQGVLRLNPNGTLDGSFGTGGLVIQPDTYSPQGVLVDSSGRILTASTNKLIRYLPDGTLDGSFGAGGILSPPIMVYDLALAPDGKLVTGGGLRRGADRAYAAARFLYSSTPSPTPTTHPGQFQDVPPAQPFYFFIECMGTRGIISGYGCGGAGEPCGAGNKPYFRPGNTLTRGQLSKIVARAAGLTDPIPSDRQTFIDVPPGSPFWLWVEQMAGRGYISGYGDGTFRPGAPVTRGQFAKIAANAAGYADPPPGQPTFLDVPVSDPFFVFVERVAGHGVISGYGCNAATLNPCTGQPETCPGLYYRPCAPATRGQAAKIVTNTFFPGCVVARK